MQKLEETTVTLDLIWGAADISKLIRRSQRATFDMLEKGQLPAK